MRARAITGDVAGSAVCRQSEPVITRESHAHARHSVIDVAARGMNHGRTCRASDSGPQPDRLAGQRGSPLALVICTWPEGVEREPCWPAGCAARHGNVMAARCGHSQTRTRRAPSSRSLMRVSAVLRADPVRRARHGMSTRAAAASMASDGQSAESESGAARRRPARCEAHGARQQAAAF